MSPRLQPPRKRRCKLKIKGKGWWGSRWPQPPKIVAGKAGWLPQDVERFQHHNPDFMAYYADLMPIPSKGHWLITVVWWADWIPLPWFAWGFENGDYFGVGLAQWDDVEKVYRLMRVRAHGTKGRIAAVSTGFGGASLLYSLWWLL